jgi:uncharacterized damage-inducible protein DinB
MVASVTDSNRRVRTRTHGGVAGVRRRLRPLCRSNLDCAQNVLRGGVGFDALSGSILSSMTTRIAGFRGEFLWELEIAERQIVAIAECIPAEQYNWRPVAQARSFSEVFVHVATGNFMLLDLVGIAAPLDLYAQVPADGNARFQGLIQRNDDLAASMREKDAVVGLLKRSLQAVSQSFARANDDELNRQLNFFGKETTVRRVYLRILAHTDEHMGQMIAYLRFNGIASPRPDWRRDRRT